MPAITGSVRRMNTFDTVVHAVGSTVLVLHQDTVVGGAEVDSDETFTIELPADLRGPIEIRLGMHGAAPVYADATGDDLLVDLMFNNHQYYA